MDEEYEEIRRQVVEFVDRVLDKERRLQPFGKSVREIKNQISVHDKVLISAVGEVLDKWANDLTTKDLKDQQQLKEQLDIIKTQIQELVKQYLSDIKQFLSALIKIVDNYIRTVMKHDDIAKEKIVELFDNFSETYTNELNKLKIKITDLINENEQLRQTIEALKERKEPRLKEIPELPSEETIEIQCPMCKQGYVVPANTKSYKCEICGTVIDVFTDNKEPSDTTENKPA